MARLEISLLGPPKISLDGAPLIIPTVRALPLIAYLAITGKSQTRETLANLLWTDNSQKQALAALRTTLWRLKATGLEDWITIARNEVQLNNQRFIDVDVVNFKSLLDKCTTHGHPPSQICLYCTSALTEAVGLYHGEFMAGFNITKASFFDDWRMQQSEIHQLLHLNALERLVKCHRTFGDINLAIHYARIWLNYDRLNENANAQLLQLYSITDQRTAGISLYKRYKEVLRNELGIEPSDEINSIYKQILSGQPNLQNTQKVKNPIFLIAEIENASQYWAKVGDEKIEIQSTFANIVRDTARRFAGRMIQKTDDNLTLLFENGQPLHCAVTIHMKLRKTIWGEAGPPNLRMVLYSTTAEGDSSFARITQMASSLLSISWGGQVVFSDQTLRLLDMPSGALVRDLGFHFLSNGEGTLHVYELLHPNLPQLEHPPLQSHTQQLVNFPVQTPVFIGREQELAELTSLFTSAENRLISLVGPGGVGKTRLAIQFATEAIKYYPDGAFFISLASIKDPAYITILLAEALKYTFYGDQNQIEQLARYLHRKKVLIILDNFEHLRVEGARLLAALLSQTHYLKFLVTSRERLNMIAETILEVHGLPVPTDPAIEEAENYSSVKLFVHNAQKTFPRFSLKDNLAAITQICQQVDGIPLGILLASSWVRVFSCLEIATEIKKNIDFLTTIAPDIEPRHRSMRAVFDSSWEYLSGEERRILRRLSIFKAGFTANSALAISDATLISLATLADKSLLMHQRDNRYQMLSTFQQYAAAKLEESPDELATTEIKFCNYYADYCAQKHQLLNTANQHTALAEMTSEIENIRTAWNLLIDSNHWELINVFKESLLTYHGMLGSFIEGRELFRSALLKLTKLNDPKLDLIRATMQQLSAWMAVKNGLIAEGLAGLTESLQVFRDHNSMWEMALTLEFLSTVKRMQGEKLQAKSCIEEALQILQDETIPKSNYLRAFTAHCQSVLAGVLIDLGDHQLARENMLASIATHNQLGTHYGTIHPLMGLGRLAYLEGEFVQAKDLYMQALETATNIYDRHGMAQIHNNLGAVFEDIVNIPESYHHVVSALKLVSETGDRRLRALIVNNLAYHQMRYLHRPAESIRTYQEAIELFSAIGDLRGITYTCYDISRAYLKVGLVDEARNHVLRGLRTAITLDSTPIILHALHGFVYMFSHLKDDERALRLCYLIINHPAVEADTQKRAIVSKVELEQNLPAETIQSASTWGKTVNLQDVIDQVLSEKMR